MLRRGRLRKILRRLLRSGRIRSHSRREGLALVLGGGTKSALIEELALRFSSSIILCIQTG